MATKITLSVDGVVTEITGNEVVLTVVPHPVSAKAGSAACEPFGIDINAERGSIDVSTLNPDNLRRRVHSTPSMDFNDFLERMDLPDSDEDDEEEDEEEDFDDEDIDDLDDDDEDDDDFDDDDSQIEIEPDDEEEEEPVKTK